KFSEQRMQRDRIGRRQRTVVVAAGRDDTSRADHRGGMAGMSPDLAGEGGNGGLAGGSGDRDHDFGLTAVEPGGGKRQEATRRGYGNDRDGCVGRSALRD